MKILNEILENESIVLDYLKKLEVKSYFVYMAGSLVEGFGNESSDIDVYVIYDSDEELHINSSELNEVVLKSEHSYINNIIHNGKRFDFEYWNINELKKIINKVNNIDANSEQYVVRLNKDEIDFIHRFKVSKCIYNEDLYVKYRKQLEFKNLQFIQIVSHSEQYDSYIEDLQGALQSRDLETSYLLILLLIETALTSYLCMYGETNPSRKWLLRKLDNYVKKFDDSTIKGKYFDLISYRFDPSNIEEYIEEAIEFTSKLNLDTQKFLNSMQKTRIGEEE